MSQKKLKAGDQIKITNISRSLGSSEFTVGKVYTIGGKYHYEDDCVGGHFGVVADDNGVANGWDSPYCEIELLEAKQIKNDQNMGIRLNNGKPRWRNFPLFLFEDVIKVGSHAEIRPGNPNGKYETFNFLKGMHINDCMDSMKRHLMKFESPYESDNDEESTESHLAHIAWNALVALHMLKTRPELDDRYKLPVKEVTLTEEEKLEAAKSIQDRGR